jgi:YVTN family beta-propeller protein
MALVLSATAVDAQWLEKVIFLPDSLSGVPWPSCIALDSARGKVYISGLAETGWPRLLDCYIVVADATTGHKLGRITVRGMTSSLCYNPVAGKLYAAHPDTGVVSVIDPAGDSVVANVAGVSWPTWLLCNATNGSVYCLSEDAGGALTIIDPSGDSVVDIIALPGTHAAAASLPRVGKVYCARGASRSVCVFDALTDSLVRVVELPAYIWDMVVSTTRDRAYFLLGSMGSMELAVVDTRNDSLLRTIATGAADNRGMICYNPRRDELYFPGFSDTILVLGGACDSVVRRLHPGGRFRHYLACLPEQDFLFSADSDSEVETVRVMDLASGNLVGALEVVRTPVATLVDAARRKVYYVNQRSGDVAVIPAPTGPLEASRIVVGAVPTKFLYAELANKVYCADLGNSLVSVIDGETNRVVADVPAGYEMNDICYSPVSNKVYVANGLDSSVTIIDCITDTVIRQLPVGQIPRALCYSPAQNRVYCASYLAEKLVVIDCEDDSVVARVEMRPLDPHKLFYNPARDEVYCRGFIGVNSTAIVDCSSNRVVGSWPYLVGPPAVYCAPEEKIFYWGGSIRVIDALRDSMIDSLYGTPGASDCCYNSTEHKVYFSDVLGHTLLVVDAVTNSLLRVLSLPGPDGTLYDAAHNKVYVAARADSGQVWIIDGASDSIVGCVGTLGHHPSELAWNRSRGRVYCANRYSGSISVIRDTSPSAMADAPRPLPISRATPTLMLAGDVRLETVPKLYDAAGRRLAVSQTTRIPAAGPGVYFTVGVDGKARKFVVVR